jgi:hypothetical protein
VWPAESKSHRRWFEAEIFERRRKKNLDNEGGSCVIERLLKSGRVEGFSAVEYRSYIN